MAVRLKFLMQFSIEIRLKFRAACQDCQSGESAVKCLSEEYSRMLLVGFEPTPC